MDGRTPEYMVREELQREKIRIRAGMRAWGYERRLGEGRGNELARLRWEELKETGREGKVGSEWEEGRRRYFRDRGVEFVEVVRGRGEGGNWFGGIVKEHKERHRKERCD